MSSRRDGCEQRLDPLQDGKRTRELRVVPPLGATLFFAPIRSALDGGRGGPHAGDRARTPPLNDAN